MTHSIRYEYVKLAFMSAVCMTLLIVQSADAAEWWKSGEEKNGFSEFAPPAIFSASNHRQEKFEWRSGSTIDGFNSERYGKTLDNLISRNPWKPVSKFNKRQPVYGQRPWGNVPQTRLSKNNNMRLHDQQFKHWVRLKEARYKDGISSSLMPADPLQSMYRYPGGNLPGGFVPFSSYAPGLYHMYPVSYQPYGIFGPGW